MTRGAIVLNAVAYQLVWFATVLGAGRGLWWAGPLAAFAFAALHLGVMVRDRGERRRDLALVAAAVACGLVIDGVLSGAGAVVFAASSPALPPGGAPLWMLTLWAAFALTLRHSLRAVTARPVLAALLAALLGAVGGPLAYLGAARATGAVTFPEPSGTTLAMLGGGWCLALGLLAMLASRPVDAAPASRAPLAGGAA
jgi:hypothetical protein